MNMMKRISTLLLVFYLVCGSLPPAFGAYDYHNIPGVTAEEIESIERIINLRDSFEFSGLYSSDIYNSETGNIAGFLSVFCDVLETIFDIPFNLVVYEQNELVDALNSYQSDFTFEIPYISEGTEKYITTDPIIERTIAAFRLKDSVPLSLIARDRPLRYGFLRDSYISKSISGIKTSPFEAITVLNCLDAEELLKSGEIDAFLAEETASAVFDDSPNIISSKFLPLMVNKLPISTANPELRPFISVIQKYIKNGGSEELKALRSEEYLKYHKDKLFRQLTDREKEYIDEHVKYDKKISFAASYDNYPTCFYNGEAKEYQGVSIDVLSEISELTGLSFETSNQVGDPWYKLFSDLENGRTTFVSELLYTNERSNRFLYSPEPYSTDSYALLSVVDRPDISIEEISDYRIGLIYETGYANIFREWFPNHSSLVNYTRYEEAFIALEKGEVDFLMGTKNLLLNISNYLEKPGFKANIMFDYVSKSAYGFAKNEEILCSIFGKAQNLIDVADISNRWTLKMFDYRTKVERTRLYYFACMACLFAVIILLLVVLFIKNQSANRKLEATVEKRTCELEKQTEIAKVASRAKSNFLARMSHEIRTPLNAIIGMSNVAIQASEPKSKASLSIENVISASKHLLGILNDVLDMSKVEAGKLTLSANPFEIRDALFEVYRMILPRCEEKKLTFEYDIDNLPTRFVIGDKLRLNQVLINLLSNSVKFTPPNGLVQLHAACRESDENLEITFSIEDNGIGITEEQMPKLFLAFEQANSSIATRFGGVGLGLSISQSIVNLMGGSIGVKSSVGQGSKFSFSIELPIDENAGDSPANEHDLHVDLTGKRILIVEDVVINRIILIELLGETKAEIREAENGAMALKMFEKSEPGYYDCILMDIQMPIMDGYESTRRIRALDRKDAKTVPIIAITANAYKEDIEMALSSGMNRHLAKPVDLADLINTLKEML